MDAFYIYISFSDQPFLWGSYQLEILPYNWTSGGKFRVKTHLDFGTDYCLRVQPIINSFCTVLFFL